MKVVLSVASIGNNIINMRYRPEIDGLRAIAVIPVILFHAGVQLFSGGFIGVDVFFVISGYLITTIILAELETGQFSLLKFYERRARRILPALYLVMAVCLPFACLWLMPSDAIEFANSAIAVVVFASNIFFWQHSNYFDAGTELKPLLHTWSLGVEEQFYVLFPLVLMFAWRMGRRRIVRLVAVVALLSFALAVYLSSTKPVAAFFLLPTRAWELAVGSLIAFYLEANERDRIPLVLKQVLSLIGFGLIVVGVLTLSKETPFPGVYALIPTVGAGLIIVFALPDTFVGRLLMSKVLVGVGLVSYSAYLWHQPLLAFARHRSLAEPDEVVVAGLVALAFGLAYVTWRYVETPFRRGALISKQLLWRVSLASAVVLVVSTVGLQLATVEGKTKLATDMEAQWRIYTCFFEVDQPYTTLLQNHCDGASEASVQTHDGTSRPSNRFVLYGDSLAAQLYPGLARVLGEDRIIQLTGGSCWAVRVTAGRCADFYDWFVNDYVPNHKLDPIIVSSNWLRLYEKIGDEEFRLQLAGLFEKLKDHRVIIYSQVARLSADVQRYTYKLEMFEQGIPKTLKLGTDDLDAVNAVLSEESEKFGFEFIDISQLFCARSQCDVVKDGVVYFGDRLHLTTPGSVLVAQLTHGMLTQKHTDLPSRGSDTAGDASTVGNEALMVRNLDGTIRYWSPEAKALYGWEPQDALGSTSHRLLKTVFPVSLDVIQEELRAKGRWVGQLIHVRRDGSRVTVRSQWSLTRSPTSQDQPATVIEVNDPLSASSSDSSRGEMELLSLLRQPRCSSSSPQCQRVS
ncbi:MAG: acyltransferase family protein [Nitrospira sp.]|nr:acyltransferase family protein [Nitrospira sp.]